MARRLADVAAALDVVVGPDPTDLRSLPRTEPSWLAGLEDPRPPARVAWCPTLGYAEVDAEVLAVCERAVRTLEALGAEIVEVDAVFDHDPLDAWLTLTGVYNLHTLGRFRADPTVWSRVDPVLAMVIDGAAAVTGLQIVEAEDEAHRLNLRLVSLFRDVRLLVTPTMAALPPPAALDGKGLVNGTEDVNWVKLTYPFNLTRSPAASVCAGLSSSGLPVGVQLVGPQHGDAVVLRAAAALEEALGFDAIAPAATR
jgi:aspartyl-tRNA(Asn)/glutamyl-tRNA(Gln) amidotransferase subunit A